MTPDSRRPRRSGVQRVVAHRSIIRALDVTTEAEDGRTLRAMTRNSWQRLAVVPSVGVLFGSQLGASIPQLGGSLPLLLPAAELTTAFPIASGIMMATALATNWFLPRVEIITIKLKEIKPDYWLVLRRGPIMITVTEVIASIHSYAASQVTLALRTGFTRTGEPDDEVEIADLRDPFQRWRHHRAFAESRDLSSVQKIITLLEAYRPGPPDRRTLAVLAVEKGMNNPDTHIDGAIVVGFIREEYGWLRPTLAGHASLGATRDKQNVRDFLDAIEAKLEILRRQLYESEIQQVETQAKVLNTAIFNGQLHTPNAMRALRILLNIAGQLLLGASGNALYEALAHFAGLG